MSSKHALVWLAIKVLLLQLLMDSTDLVVLYQNY
jgi:hypothetical protein